MLDPDRALPAGERYGNLRVNRSAETLGRTVGSAVSKVRQFPRRVDEARSQIRKAGQQTRDRASAAVLEMMDSAAQRADRLRHVTEATISGLADSARSAGSQVGNQTAEVWDEFRRITKARVDYASRRAVGQWKDARRSVQRLQQEDPVRFLAIVAGTAFVIGAGLRIWRSSHE